MSMKGPLSERAAMSHMFYNDRHTNKEIKFRKIVLITKITTVGAKLCLLKVSES